MKYGWYILLYTKFKYRYRAHHQSIWLSVLDSCRVDNMASLEHAKTARDCLRFLKKERLFIPTDVIFIQYLLKSIDCRDLFDKCYRYAEAQKALCFYEKPPGNYMINCYQKLASNCLISSFFVCVHAVWLMM